MKLDLSERIAAAKTAVTIASAWARLGLPNPPRDGNTVTRPPDREDGSECFSIFLAKDGWQRFKDHKTGASGDVFDFVELVAKEDRPAAIQRVLGWAGDTASLSGHGATSLSPPPQVTTSPGRKIISSDERARLSREFDRGRWPRFTDPTQADIEQIARVRKLDTCAVHAINATGMLQVADHNGRRVFVIREGIFAQWRPLSGEPCDGKNKALCFKGSEGAFIGRCLLGSDPQPVILVEGCVGLLEAAALIGFAEAGWGWTTVAAVSSGSKFSTAPDLLTALAGRRVRIVADAGKAGADAAASWCTDLHAAGATVDFFDIPAGCRDLGPIAQNPSSHAELIHRLFTI
jgi:hypothetical protein